MITSLFKDSHRLPFFTESLRSLHDSPACDQALRPPGLHPRQPPLCSSCSSPTGHLFPKCVVTGDTLPRPECSQDSLQLPLWDAWLTPAPPSGLGLETSLSRTGSLTAPPHSLDSLPDEHG